MLSRCSYGDSSQHLIMSAKAKREYVAELLGVPPAQIQTGMVTPKRPRTVKALAAASETPSPPQTARSETAASSQAAAASQSFFIDVGDVFTYHRIYCMVALTANIDKESAPEILPKLIQATAIPAGASLSEPSRMPTKNEEELLAEIAARKKEIAAKKKEWRQLLIETWGPGISKEVQKAKEAGIQAGKFPDEDAKNLYSSKFAKHHELLDRERIIFEDVDWDPWQLSLVDVEAADEAVKDFKKDYVAFQKLKTCYEITD